MKITRIANNIPIKLSDSRMYRRSEFTPLYLILKSYNPVNRTIL